MTNDPIAASHSYDEAWAAPHNQRLATLVATTEPNVDGDRAWYGWKATLAGGESFTGAEFVEFDADGRIARATTFCDYGRRQQTRVPGVRWRGLNLRPILD